MSAQHKAADGNGYWPLADGPLPPGLFHDEHLRIVLFEYLPLEYQCAAVAIRHGIKSHLKRTAPGTARPSGNDLLARDRRMASLFGNIPSARDRAGEISFVAEESFNRRGLGGTRERLLPSVKSFAELLWMGYRKAPNMADLHRWLQDAGVERPDLARGTFLTAASLGTAMASGTCPVAADDLWLARSVTLFASLLSGDECRDLLEAAARLGSSPLVAGYFADGVPAAIANNGVGQAALASEVASSRQHARPRLVVSETVPLGEYPVSPEAVRWQRSWRGRTPPGAVLGALPSRHSDRTSQRC